MRFVILAVSLCACSSVPDIHFADPPDAASVDEVSTDADSDAGPPVDPPGRRDK